MALVAALSKLRIRATIQACDSCICLLKTYVYAINAFFNTFDDRKYR